MAFVDTHDHGVCVRKALDAARRLCRERNVRLTPIRQRVLEIVWRGHKPLGAYEVLEFLRAERGRAEAPTVYRALEFLLDLGLIHRLESLNAYIGCVYPGSRHASQFIICQDCGNTTELDGSELARAIDWRAQTMGFTVSQRVIEVRGNCADCRATGAVVHD